MGMLPASSSVLAVGPSARSSVDRLRILGGVRSVIHAVVTYHAGHAQAVVRKQMLSPFLSSLSMLFEIAPFFDRLFVAPERQRKQLAWFGQTLESLDREETVDAIQVLAQRRRPAKIGVSVTLAGDDFEDHRNHGVVSFNCAGTPNVPSTTSTKVRSSRRMSLFACANAKFSRPCASAFRHVRYAS